MIVPYAGKNPCISLADGERRAIRQAVFRETERNPFVEAHDLLHIVQKTDEFLARVGHAGSSPQHRASKRAIAADATGSSFRATTEVKLSSSYLFGKLMIKARFSVRVAVGKVDQLDRFNAMAPLT
jgi:hypothetical protein